MRFETWQWLLICFLTSLGSAVWARFDEADKMKAVEPQDVKIVRMLDVTIKDSNTSNRRQRFECLPVKETR